MIPRIRSDTKQQMNQTRRGARRRLSALLLWGAGAAAAGLFPDLQNRAFWFFYRNSQKTYFLPRQDMLQWEHKEQGGLFREILVCF